VNADLRGLRRFLVKGVPPFSLPPLPLFLCVSKVLAFLFLIRTHPRKSAVGSFLFQISVISEISGAVSSGFCTGFTAF
jgi:hypothetical protein